MLKIFYKNRVSNEEVLSRLGEERWSLNTVRQRKTVYFGHLIRARGLQRLLLEEKWKVSSAEKRKGVLGQRKFSN